MITQSDLSASDGAACSLAAISAEMVRMVARGELGKQPSGKYLATKKFPHATESEIDHLLDLLAANVEVTHPESKP